MGTLRYGATGGEKGIPETLLVKEGTELKLSRKVFAANIEPD